MNKLEYNEKIATTALAIPERLVQGAAYEVKDAVKKSIVPKVVGGVAGVAAGTGIGLGVNKAIKQNQDKNQNKLAMSEEEYNEKVAGVAGVALSGVRSMGQKILGGVSNAGAKIATKGIDEIKAVKAAGGTPNALLKAKTYTGAAIADHPAIATGVGAVGTVGAGKAIFGNKNGNQINQIADEYSDEVEKIAYDILGIDKEAAVIKNVAKKIVDGVRAGGSKLHDSGYQEVYERSVGGKGEGIKAKIKIKAGNTMLDHPKAVIAGGVVAAKGATTAAGVGAIHHHNKKNAEKIASEDEGKKKV